MSLDGSAAMFTGSTIGQAVARTFSRSFRLMSGKAEASTCSTSCRSSLPDLSSSKAVQRSCSIRDCSACCATFRPSSSSSPGRVLRSALVSERNAENATKEMTCRQTRQVDHPFGAEAQRNSRVVQNVPDVLSDPVVFALPAGALDVLAQHGPHA